MQNTNDQIILRILRMRWAWSHFARLECWVASLNVIRPNTSDFIATQMRIMAAVQAEQEDKMKRRSVVAGNRSRKSPLIPPVPSLPRQWHTSWIYTWESGVAQSYTLLCITDLAVRGSLEALFVSLYLMVFALVRVLRGIDFQVQFLGWVVVRVQAVHVSSAMSKFAEIQFRSSTWGIQLQQYTSMCRMHPLTILCRGVWVSLLP